MWTYLSQRWIAACQNFDGPDKEQLTFAGTEEYAMVTRNRDDFGNLEAIKHLTILNLCIRI